MSVATARMRFGPSRLFARRTAFRHASTTSEATQATSNTASRAKETVSNVTSKASEGLTRVSSSAGSSLRRASEGVSNAAGRIGGRIGSLISFTQSLIPPTIYYSKVGFELTRLVFRDRKMTPPNLGTFQQYFQAIFNKSARERLFPALKDGMSGGELLSRIRNMNRQQLASAGVLAAECLGFFSVGEMLGRFKMVGYHGDQHHHETATPHG